MASHLLGHPTTLGMISSILVIEDQAVKYAYDWLLDYRYEILLAPADIRSFIPDQERIDALLPAVPS